MRRVSLLRKMMPVFEKMESGMRMNPSIRFLSQLILVTQLPVFSFALELLSSSRKSTKESGPASLALSWSSM